jgi:hypothetical protein
MANYKILPSLEKLRSQMVITAIEIRQLKDKKNTPTRRPAGRCCGNGAKLDFKYKGWKMIDKQKLIEAGAKAIFKEYYPNGYSGCEDYYAATDESHRNNLRRCAKAALTAIVRELPKAKDGAAVEAHYINGGLYKQLKEMS